MSTLQLQLRHARLWPKSFGVAAGLLLFAAASSATTFTFNTDPFAGIPNPPPVIQGEPSINFNPATDSFAFNPSAFSFANNIQFANNTIENLPVANVNAIVLQTLDNDKNPATPFGARQAAELIGAHVTTPGPGVFIYFNSTLQLDRLVFSTNLTDPNANLAVLARFPNLSGQTGISALPSFSSANFTATPEPSTLLLMGIAGSLLVLVNFNLALKPENNT